MEAIEKTYFDTCEVWRMSETQQPNGSYKQQRTQIYGDVKCAISIGTRPALNTLTANQSKQYDSANMIHTQDKLYLNPSYIVNQGDEIRMNHLGRQITATAGLPFIYPTHQVLHMENIRYA